MILGRLIGRAPKKRVSAVPASTRQAAMIGRGVPARVRPGAVARSVMDAWRGRR